MFTLIIVVVVVTIVVIIVILVVIFIITVVIIIIVVVKIIAFVIVSVEPAYQEDHATFVSRIHPVLESTLSHTPFLAPVTNKSNFARNIILRQIKINLARNIILTEWEIKTS